MDNQVNSLQGIAVIGMAGRFPGAKNVDEFWQNLCDGKESISFFSDEELIAAGIDSNLLNHPNYVKAGAILTDIEMFDAGFFDFSPREAEIMDPQHRIFLECAWEALENAGYNSETYKGWIGVYAGGSLSTYLTNNLLSNSDLAGMSTQVGITNDKDYIPIRVSYKMNLQGPSLNINTACSTSLVAIHVACRGLLNYECDIALSGGISIKIPHKTGYLYQKEGIASPDGHCRAFDSQAQGTIEGNGVGIVVLKRLKDAVADGDYIYAVIKGSAINNDGAAKVGFTAPSISGQAKVIAEAQAIAGVAPETITYIEAHGTGTTLGDPIEISALKKVFTANTQKKHFCGIGSVKTNVGHLNTASGVTSLIKTVLALKHQKIPPSLHFQQPNPEIDFENSPFYINTKLAKWEAQTFPRRAGVSSFGFGGTNAHVVLEEAPVSEQGRRGAGAQGRDYKLLVLAAKSEQALEKATDNLITHLRAHPQLELADVAYTLQVGRRVFDYCRMVVCRDLNDAVTALTQTTVIHHRQASQNSLVFMFSGQGTQYINMGKELYQSESKFRQTVDECAAIIQGSIGKDIREILYPNPENQESAQQQLQQTAITQIALFVVEYALAQLWISWGIRPHAMIGHSIGEYVAATIAGVFELAEALQLVVIRGQLMQQMTPGKMLAVPLSVEKLQPLLNENLSLAAINTPESCVVSGTEDAIAAIQDALAAAGIECRGLHTSHGFHSHLMQPMLAEFGEQVQKLSLNAPQIPIISNLTGTWMSDAQATSRDYWCQHLRHTVRFSQGITELLQQTDRIFLEVGPGRTLNTLTKQHLKSHTAQLILTSLRHPQEQQSDVVLLLNTLGKLWMTGKQIDWDGFYHHQKRYRLPLPTYPFEHQRYWIDAKAPSMTANISSAISNADSDTVRLYTRPNINSSYVAPTNEIETQIAQIWQEVLGIAQVGIYDNFFELGGDSLIASQLFSRLSITFPIELSLKELLFQAPNVAQQANMIEQLLVDKISELSEAEVAALLGN